MSAVDFLSFDFSGADDKVSTDSKEVELLPQGLYKAVVKSAIYDIQENKTPKLYVNFELEDYPEKTLTHTIILTDKPFNKENMKNLVSRCQHSEMNYDNYISINPEVKVPKSKAELEFYLVSKKVLVDVFQEPWFPKNMETGFFKTLNIPMTDVIGKMPKALLGSINKHEEYHKMKYENMPEVYFNNKVKGCGVHFYKDFDPAKEFKNSKSYEFYQELKNLKVDTTNSIGESVIPF